MSIAARRYDIYEKNPVDGAPVRGAVSDGCGLRQTNKGRPSAHRDACRRGSAHAAAGDALSHQRADALPAAVPFTYAHALSDPHPLRPSPVGERRVRQLRRGVSSSGMGGRTLRPVFPYLYPPGA